MSFSDLYSSGFRERNRDHFAAIVRVALSDGQISEGEHEFINRLAKNLDIPDHEMKAVLKDPTQYPINPPVLYDSRLERLYDIARMVNADQIAEDDELRLMRRLGIGLGFSPENVSLIVHKAMDLLQQGVDLETFKDEIKHMNR